MSAPEITAELRATHRRRHRTLRLLRQRQGLKCLEVNLSSLVQRVAGERNWLAQEYVASKPYLYQWGASGYAVHQVAWGLFCFGGYSGGFLRMEPAHSGNGVINAARGAAEGLIFEV